MGGKIGTEEVQRVAELARLEFTGEELERFTGEFAAILDFFEQLKEPDTSAAEPLFHALSDAEETPFREDEPGGSLEREEALSQAPSTDGEHFKVPKVIE